MLSVIIFLPVVGSLVIALIPGTRLALIRALAVATAASSFALSLALFLRFDQQAAGLQFVERLTWVALPTVQVSYFVGVDGLNLPLVILTTQLTLMAILGSWHVETRPKEYFAMLQMLETGVLGVFAAMDFLLFFLFWEVELIPMYLLIGIWGGPRREYAAIKFVVYTLVGSGLMLVGILALYFNATPHTFDLVALACQQYSPAFASLVFLFLFTGFAVKLPVFPLHTWLPDAHVEAPTAVSVLLAGVLLKTGGYGMLRVLVGILPGATHEWAWLLGLLAATNVLYGSAVAMAQRDLKAMVAYSSTSHMGYVLLGIAALTTISLSGAAIQLFVNGTITVLLFLLVGNLYERAHTRQVTDFGGLATRQPLLATFFVVGGLAALGLPGLSGFIAEFTVFIGSDAVWPLFTILAAAGIVITAGYVLGMLRRVFFGPLNPRWQQLGDVRGVDLIPLVSLIGVIVLIGVDPAILTNVVGSGVATLKVAAVAHGVGHLASAGLRP